MRAWPAYAAIMNHKSYGNWSIFSDTYRTMNRFMWQPRSSAHRQHSFAFRSIRGVPDKFCIAKNRSSSVKVALTRPTNLTNLSRQSLKLPEVMRKERHFTVAEIPPMASVIMLVATSSAGEDPLASPISKKKSIFAIFSVWFHWQSWPESSSTWSSQWTTKRRKIWIRRWFYQKA